MTTLREFQCPFCNAPIETYSENWQTFNCPSCNEQLTTEIVFNHYNKLEQELKDKIQILNSLKSPNSIDEKFQFTLRQTFTDDRNSLLGVWKYAGMPMTLKELETSLDFNSYDQKALYAFPSPSVQRKKSSSQLLLQFFTTYNDISEVNNELFKIIIKRTRKEEDYVVLSFYFKALQHYDFDLKTALDLLLFFVDKLGITFFDYTDLYYFGKAKFPESEIMNVVFKVDSGVLGKEVGIKIIEQSLRQLTLTK